MSKHTPGPWHVIDGGPHWNCPEIKNFQVREGCKSERGYDVAWSDAGELVVEHVYEEADARLIAAAPELLEALIEAEKIVSEHYKHTHELVTHMKICAAIARATGGNDE